MRYICKASNFSIARCIYADLIKLYLCCNHQLNVHYVILFIDSKETKPSAKNPNLSNRKEINAPKPNYRSKYANVNQPSLDNNTKLRTNKDKGTYKNCFVIGMHVT